MWSLSWPSACGRRQAGKCLRPADAAFLGPSEGTWPRLKQNPGFHPAFSGAVEPPPQHAERVPQGSGCQPGSSQHCPRATSLRVLQPGPLRGPRPFTVGRREGGWSESPLFRTGLHGLCPLAVTLFPGRWGSPPSREEGSMVSDKEEPGGLGPPCHSAVITNPRPRRQTPSEGAPACGRSPGHHRSRHPV